MEFKVFDLGLVDFYRAWNFQKEIFQKVKNGSLESGLIFCRHYPVITLGRLADKRNILLSRQELTKRDIAVYEIERGGDVTYHGPGQLVAYPVFNLARRKKDIRLFLRELEGIAIASLAEFGIEAARLKGLTGVWVGKAKIVSIGIAIRKWISFHGLSLNIEKNDLGNFRLIRPCGMDIEMTSLETILGRKAEFALLKKCMARKFKEAMQ
ncbi:MAG: lipoyl(octanoyl) transferase LipB [Candidatus Omnitrophica bacterium]|nr:lipoyl(octanoyl) transferase LipB [Candidatus Omnitrophota bacterium]